MIRVWIVLLLALSSPVLAQNAPLVQATATRLAGTEEAPRIEVDLSGAVEPQVFTLADPYRVIVDLPGVVFGNNPLPHEALGLVAAYRYGLIAPGRSRIVIDAAEPVRVVSAEIREAGANHRLTIELARTERQTFLVEMSKNSASSKELPRSATPQAEKDVADTRPLLVIDPGHGGIDTGAKGAGGEEEKKVVLDFARTLAAKLTASKRYRVLMTREDDTFIALADRVRVGRDNGADLFLSIHADSLSDPFGVRGATVYTLSEKASDAEAARLADKENRADVIAGINLTEEPADVAGILIDLARRETKVFSTRFAKGLVGSVKSTMRMNKNPIRSAGFLVLKAPDVPSVLLELGYMSSREDLKLLTSEAWRNKAASAMVGAIDSYFSVRGTGPATPAGPN